MIILLPKVPTKSVWVTSVSSGGEGTGSSAEIPQRLEEMAHEMNSEVLVIERE